MVFVSRAGSASLFESVCSTCVRVVTLVELIGMRCIREGKGEVKRRREGKNGRERQRKGRRVQMCVSAKMAKESKVKKYNKTVKSR